jgi:hypothetical protein
MSEVPRPWKIDHPVAVHARPPLIHLEKRKRRMDTQTYKKFYEMTLVKGLHAALEAFVKIATRHVTGTLVVNHARSLSARSMIYRH